MTLFDHIKLAAWDAINNLYPEATVDKSAISVNQTKPEFAGDYTVVLFPFVKMLRMKPDVLGQSIGNYMMEHTTFFSSFQIVSGFLNFTVRDEYWIPFLLNNFNNTSFGEKAKEDNRVMVEYSSPNTNKPLHFGHLRNIFLGAAMAEVLGANGQEVIKANLINDRGIHICKSMLAWQRYGNGATPESTGIKGDHLVGDYYVRFNNVLKEQTTPILERFYTGDFADFDGADTTKITGLYEAYHKPENKGNAERIEKIKDEIKELAQNRTEVMLATKKMLQQWEAGDADVRALWERMNGWVYEGFAKTYEKLGISFDKMYYESNTYLYGKALVMQGLEKGVLYKKEDGSIWVDLTEEGLDHKLLLRGDGTSVYITQDLGTAKLKYDEFKLDKSIYVIADEQNYHMQVLKLILKKLGEPCADGIFHLSYGMVELPTGKMKSREGTVVDADDMIDEMVDLSRQQVELAGKTEGFTAGELQELYRMIGLGALKFYLLQVEPRKKMIFNPQESIDLHGFTATFIQYAHARICSILRKEGLPLLPDNTRFQQFTCTEAITPAEKKLILALEQYPAILQAAAEECNPSAICNYSFQLAQQFNSFYDEHSIAKAENQEKKDLRLMVIIFTAQTLRHSMKLLGIRLPEKM